MAWDVLASAALPLIGGIFGSDIVGDVPGGGSAQTMKEGIEYLERLQQKIPEIADQWVNWEGLIQQGLITPETIAEIQTDPSKLRDFVGTSEFKDAGTKGLEELRAIAEGGFSAADLASMEDIRRRVATQERGQREAILQGAQQRGVGGSGLEMYSNLMAQQDAADRNALENLMTAARGEERRIGASRAGAELGSSLRGQEFGEERAMDEAERLINQFNAQMKMRKAEGDVGRRERAQYQNLGESQRIADTNAQRRYETDLRNKELYQQKFQNQLGVGQAMMGAYGGKAGAQANRMDRKYKLLGGGIGGAGQILGDYYSSRKKERDPDSFMRDYMSFEEKYNKKNKKKSGGL